MDTVSASAPASESQATKRFVTGRDILRLGSPFIAADNGREYDAALRHAAQRESLKRKYDIDTKWDIINVAKREGQGVPANQSGNPQSATAVNGPDHGERRYLSAVGRNLRVGFEKIRGLLGGPASNILVKIVDMARRPGIIVQPIAAARPEAVFQQDGGIWHDVVADQQNIIVVQQDAVVPQDAVVQHNAVVRQDVADRQAVIQQAVVTVPKSPAAPQALRIDQRPTMFQSTSTDPPASLLRPKKFALGPQRDRRPPLKAESDRASISTVERESPPDTDFSLALPLVFSRILFSLLSAPTIPYRLRTSVRRNRERSRTEFGNVRSRHRLPVIYLLSFRAL